MRIISIIILSLLASICYADYVTCYSHNKIIYQKHVKHVYYDDDLFIIDEGKNNAMIFYNANCLVKVKKETKHQKKGAN